MSSEDNWAEMRRLEEMDAALSSHHQDLDMNIQNALKPKHFTRPTSGLKSKRELPLRAAPSVQREHLDGDSLDDESHTGSNNDGGEVKSRVICSFLTHYAAPMSARSTRRATPASPSEPDVSKAPDTAVR